MSLSNILGGVLQGVGQGYHSIQEENRKTELENIKALREGHLKIMLDNDSPPSVRQAHADAWLATFGKKVPPQMQQLAQHAVSQGAPPAPIGVTAAQLGLPAGVDPNSIMGNPLVGGKQNAPPPMEQIGIPDQAGQARPLEWPNAVQVAAAPPPPVSEPIATPPPPPVDLEQRVGELFQQMTRKPMGAPGSDELWLQEHGKEGPLLQNLRTHALNEQLQHQKTDAAHRIMSNPGTTNDKLIALYGLGIPETIALKMVGAETGKPEAFSTETVEISTPDGKIQPTLVWVDKVNKKLFNMTGEDVTARVVGGKPAAAAGGFKEQEYQDWLKHVPKGYTADRTGFESYNRDEAEKITQKNAAATFGRQIQLAGVHADAAEEAKLQSSAIKASNNALTLKSILDSAESHVKNPTPRGDIAIIVSAVRAMNPGTVRLPVQEIELELKAGSWGDRLKRQYEVAVNGLLPNDQRADLMDIVRKEVGANVSNAGALWDDVYGDKRPRPPHLRQGGAAATAPPSPGGNPFGFVPKAQ